MKSNLAAETSQRQFSPAKIFFFYVLMFLAILVMLEIGTRAVFAYSVGPSVLLYGTPFERQKIIDPEFTNTTFSHNNVGSGYTKYFPKEIRYEIEPTGERWITTINNHGFRGDDFEVAKVPGTTRIVTLGASSTFGFTNRDHETYPHQLEEILNSQPDDSYEVINLGVPHLYASEIRALFEAEALPLNPDVVTFYEGSNDAGLVREMLNVDRNDFGSKQLQSIRRTLGQYSIVIKGLNEIWSEYQGRKPYKLEDIDAAAEIVAQRFLNELEAIAEECRKRNMTFIVANQQRRSTEFDADATIGMTYQKEQTLIRNKIDNGEVVSLQAISFVAHATLMKHLMEWATANKYPFVDVITALDGQRINVTTHVHLNAKGNRVIAEKLSGEILAP
jgi:lysophospholipase L1-like esterase